MSGNSAGNAWVSAEPTIAILMPDQTELQEHKGGSGRYGNTRAFPWKVDRQVKQVTGRMCGQEDGKRQ